jgi:hypothetical protein
MGIAQTMGGAQLIIASSGGAEPRTSGGEAVRLSALDHAEVPSPLSATQAFDTGDCAAMGAQRRSISREILLIAQRDDGINFHSPASG